jgi:hypothetical protein
MIVRRCDILHPFIERERDSRRQCGRSVIGQLWTRYAAVSTDFSLVSSYDDCSLTFFIDIHSTGEHGDLPTRQRKAAALSPNS